MQQRPSPLAPRTLSGARLKFSTLLIAGLVSSWTMPSAAFAQSDESKQPEAPSSLQEVYQDWIVTCRTSAAKSDKPESLCQMAQELRDKKSGQLILSLVLPAKQLPDGANAVVVAPFGLDLSKGVTGEVHHVDAGYHVQGMKNEDAPDISVV